MVSIYNIIILLFYTAGITISTGNKRAVLWLGASLAAYVLSVAYWRSGAPAPEVIAGICDFAVIVGIYMYGRYRWELWVWMLLQACLAVNLVYAASEAFGLGIVTPLDATIVLEALNIAIVSTISIIAVFHRSGHKDARAFRDWRSVFGLHLPSHRKATADRWER